ncbi:hypothetical protein CJD36_012510 [Flavipsychrobacter stenotrophus]|uniref:Uncharacterized protein n=1 Tax=Flavipsychrobacter stenotrophus TaxID=2077091 RepID=A0A2S7SW16_9BACT|nr:hypothetical protein [Flavipsychrobacter stenotrophus]PQJ10785.1 hypothetical protein CJD36_012510 [Flavipsychrobacter stenotrophus]
MLPDELQQQIRFNIAQLSAKNGQADFEKICLYFSRKRIHTNILPATGPVQAGGDQGRDFETFHSYVSILPIANSLFIGNFSVYPVAFACSLEKDPARKKGKIYQDVQSILKSGSKVERIYFFSGEDIPVAKRHKSENEVKSVFGVELQIIDAQTLSQHLADGDLFWIAIQYLKMPSEAYPVVSEDWYAELLKEYKEGSNRIDTIGEFCEIKGAVRHIYKNNDLKKDLLFWLPKLDIFINTHDTNRFLIRKAIYEKFVASLIGLDNVSGQETNIENYFSDFEECDSIAELTDAQLLLSFCTVSCLKNRHNVSIEYFKSIANKFEKLLLTKINTTQNIDIKVALIDIHANLIFHDVLSDANTRVQMFANRMNSVIKLLPRTHFYGISALANRINEFIEILLRNKIDASELEKIAGKIDTLLAKQGGRNIVADKLKTRAITYLNNNELFKAIDCLHELKIKWFNEESIQESIQACLLLAKAYQKLNLFYASKYYALIASYLSMKDNMIECYTYFLEGLSLACENEYKTGSWLNYINLLDGLIATHYAMTKDFTVYNHDDVHKIIYYPAIIKNVSIALFPNILPLLDKRYSNWEDIKNEIDELSVKMPKIKREDILDTASKQLYGNIFNDLGEIRTIGFNALGSNWQFHFNNDYETNSVAEEFISKFQILIVDIKDLGICLLSTNVRINISLSTAAKPSYKNSGNDDEITWDIMLPPYNGDTKKELEHHQFESLVVAQAIIYDVSLLPGEQYIRLIGERLKGENGIINKLIFGRHYADLYHNFVSKTEFNSQNRTTLRNDIYKDGFSIRSNDKLPWDNSIAPNYNKKKSLKNIETRITVFKKICL